MLCDFPKILRQLRKRRGLSQRTAAKDLGISPALLSHYEKGIRECGLDFLLKLSQYYGVSCDYLLGITDHESLLDDEFEKEALALNDILKLAAKHNQLLYDKACTLSDLVNYYLVRNICDTASRSDTFSFDFENIDYKNYVLSAITASFAEMSAIPKEKHRIPAGKYKNTNKSVLLAEKELKKRFGKALV